MLENIEKKQYEVTKKFLKSVLDTANYGIMTFKSIRNADGEIVDFEWIFTNEVAAGIIEKQVHELIGARLLDVLPGNKTTGLFSKYKEVVETGESISFEQFYPQDDLNKWFQISAVKLEDGFTVTFEDITNFKDTVFELKTKGDKYRKLFNESIDSIFLIDEDFQILEANASFMELFGYEFQALEDKSIEMMFSSDQNFSDFKKELINTGKVEEFEFYLKHHDGSRRYCLINCVVIKEESGQSNSYLGVIRDMTKRKQAEKQILQAEKLSMTGKIARTIGHEIRNPLTNLTLALEQLKDEIGDNEETEVYLEIAERNVKRIGKLITDLLQSSKPKKIKPVKQSLNLLVTDSLNLVRDRLKLQQMKLHEEYDEDLPEIHLDPDQFKIALLNLYINAIEAMKPSEGKITVRTYKDDNCLCLSISDNGKGISEQDLDRLFDPYFTAKKDGTGLGLTTVQNIIGSHDGNIEVQSEIDKGTSFIISLSY